MNKSKLEAFVDRLFSRKPRRGHLGRTKDAAIEFEIIDISDIQNDNIPYKMPEKIVEKFKFDETRISISILPVEILEKIFQHLDFYDRMNASLCCKQWRIVFIHSQFLENVIVKANNNLFTSRPMSSQNKSLNQISQHRASSAMGLSSFSMSSMSKFNLYMYSHCVNLQFDADSSDVSLFLKNLGYSTSTGEAKNTFLLPKVESLKFTKTTMSSKALMDIVSEAPCIQNLEIIDCDSLFMTGFLSNDKSSPLTNLTNLTSLNVSYNRYMTDVILNIFIDAAPNLTALDISFCNLVKQYCKTIDANTIPDPSKVSLTLENLIEKTLSRKLHSINLSGIEVFNYQPASLINLLKDLKTLNEIHLTNLNGLKTETVIRLSQILPELKSINLNASIQDFDFSSDQKSVDSVFKEFIVDNEGNGAFSGFEVLKLKKAKIRSPMTIAENVANFKNLKHLDLSNAMIINSFSSVKQQKQFIEKFASNLATCGKLEYLDLSYCNILISDTFIKIISKRLLDLTYLNLRNCSQITDISLHFISYYLKNLTDLDLSWCQNISDNGLNFQNEFEKKQKLISDFTNHLNTCNCMRNVMHQPFMLLKTKSELSSEMKQHTCACGSMLTLDNPTADSEVKEQKSSEKKSFLDLSLELGNKDFSLKQLKKLRTLKLESCKNITDIGLTNGINLFQLKELDLKLCTKITGSFVDVVDTNVNMFLNNLRCLNLNQCIGFEEKNIIRILRSSPNLRELDLSAVTSVSNALVDVLLEERTLLLALDVSFCPNLNESEINRYEQFLDNEHGSREFVLDKRFINK